MGWGPLLFCRVTRAIAFQLLTKPFMFVRDLHILYKLLHFIIYPNSSNMDLKKTWMPGQCNKINSGDIIIIETPGRQKNMYRMFRTFGVYFLLTRCFYVQLITTLL